MKTITIRNLPDDLYHAITKLAVKNRRSIQQQIRVLLDYARLMEIQSPVLRAKELRLKLKGRELGDVVDEIREERNR